MLVISNICLTFVMSSNQMTQLIMDTTDKELEWIKNQLLPVITGKIRDIEVSNLKTELQNMFDSLYSTIGYKKAFKVKTLKDPDILDEPFRTIVSNGQAIAMLINRTLVYFKIENGKIRFADDYANGLANSFANLVIKDLGIDGVLYLTFTITQPKKK